MIYWPAGGDFVEIFARLSPQPSAQHWQFSGKLFRTSCLKVILHVVLHAVEMFHDSSASYKLTDIDTLFYLIVISFVFKV